MADIHNFTLFISLTSVLIITPGPDLVYVLTQGISNGRMGGLVSALGVTSGILVHTIFAALGLSIILRTSALAFSIVKIVGALYLLYLGVKSIMSKENLALSKEKKVSNYKIFTQGLLSNTLNPKVALFFMAFLPQFIHTNSNNDYSSIPFLILGLVFALCTVIFLAFLGYYSGSIGHHLMKKKNLSSGINKVSGFVLILLGIKLAFTKQQ